MRFRALAVLVAVMLVAGVPSVFADEGDAEAPKADVKISILADYVAGDDPSPEAVEAAETSVAELRTSGIGWGALFKIYKLAEAMGVPASDLVAEIGPDGEFDFGELKNSLSDEERAVFDALPKNFGTLQAADVKAEKAKEKAERKAEREAEKAERKAERDKDEVADDVDPEEDSDS